jgi:hypothetical protein
MANPPNVEPDRREPDFLPRTTTSRGAIHLSEGDDRRNRAATSTKRLGPGASIALLPPKSFRVSPRDLSWGGNDVKMIRHKNSRENGPINECGGSFLE